MPFFSLILRLPTYHNNGCVCYEFDYNFRSFRIMLSSSPTTRNGLSVKNLNWIACTDTFWCHSQSDADFRCKNHFILLFNISIRMYNQIVSILLFLFNYNEREMKWARKKAWHRKPYFPLHFLSMSFNICAWSGLGNERVTIENYKFIHLIAFVRLFLRCTAVCV